MMAPRAKSSSMKRIMVGLLGCSGAGPVKPRHSGGDEEKDAFM